MRNITIVLILILAVIFFTPIFLGLTRIKHRKLFFLARLLQILIFLGILLLPTLTSKTGGDIAGVIGNKISVGFQAIRTGFTKVFGSLFFSDAYDGTLWIAIAVLIIGGVIFLKRRRKKK